MRKAGNQALDAIPPPPDVKMRKRAAIEFSLCWQSTHAVHQDRYFIDKVDFWRDIFPGSMGDVLASGADGHSHTETFAPGTLVPKHSEKNLVTFKKSQVSPTNDHDGLVLEPGRFYPKGYFWKPLHSFPADQSPVRLKHVSSASLVVDTNHPLARYPLTIKALVHQTSSISAQRGGALHDIAEEITANGPGMQAPVDETRYSPSGEAPLPRDDDTDDALYYRTPRLVHHLDDTARHHVRSLYGRLLEPQTRILDLMSSWESHLPDSLQSCRVEGLGLNEQELEANGRLSNYLIHDLNRQSILPFAESSFDAVVCTVSIEYICRPRHVLSELARIIKPGGILVITVSERWFPGKQIHPWADLHPFERQGLVINYLLDQGSFDNIQTESIRGYPRPAGDRYSGQMGSSDSLYFIWAAGT